MTFHPSVIGRENNVGVFYELMSGPAWIISLFKILDQLADIIIEHLNHSTVERVGLPLPLPELLWVFR